MTTHPPLRPFGALDVFAPTGVEAASFDHHAIQELGVPQPVLMENAGRSAAQLLQRLAPEGPVVALVGAGNNGGDALVLLRTLAAWGRPVKAILVADREGPEGVLHHWPVPTVRDDDLAGDDAWGAALAGAVVVDGILGTGVRGAPRERQARAIRRINASGRPVFALDVPSGVDAGDGSVAGEAVRAGVTVAFGAPKLGALLHPGRAHAGRLVAVEIGFPPMTPGDASARVVTPAWAQALLPVRGPDTHKNAVGRVLVVAGKEGMAGAAILAVRGALRAGAGLVQVCSPDANRELLQAAVPEAIFVSPSVPSALEEAAAQAAAVAVGPGMGTSADARALLERVVGVPGTAVVVDADALNLVAADGTALRPALAARPALLTPHAGEIVRLLDLDGPVPPAQRMATVGRAAAELGCAVLLKGAPSLVAVGHAPVLVDVQGSSDLATAGMGDVLTGVCAALAAQGAAPADAGALGLYLSGRAAALAGRGKALTPSDVARWLPHALQERGDGVTDLGLPFVILDLDPAR